MTETTTASSQSKSCRPTSWLSHTMVAVWAVIFMLWLVVSDNNSTYTLLSDHYIELRGKPVTERLEVMESQREEILHRSNARRSMAVQAVTLLTGVNLALFLIYQLRRTQNARQ